MVEAFRQAWPGGTIDPKQLANLIRPYGSELVAEVIADRIEAEMGMPGLGELSRVLRAYAPNASKSDPEPPREHHRPERPWARDLPELPAQVPDLAVHMDEMRDALAIGSGIFDARPKGPPEVPEIEFIVVPPSVREARERGVEGFQQGRRARLDAARMEAK